ncbi:MAG: hypothetical protein CSB34_03815 [Desulfobulbus propionicus]|nr:MAG: hypothetical protein CSB34_03815 [Desulfobulbus propionicus]PIE63329.1 MAG: hypothetical protein CSA26_12790 [Desulfobacterales bacterium]
MNKIGFVVLILLAAIGGGSWLYLSGDTRQINKQLDNLTALAAKSQEEPMLEMVRKAGTMGKIFAEECELEIEEYDHQGTYSRKDIIDRILMVRKRSTTLGVDIYDRDITVFDGNRADITATLHVTGMENEESMSDARELELNMVKHEGDWQISKVVFVQVLER